MARKAGLVAVLAGTADIIPLGRIVSRVGRVPAMRMTGKLLNVLTEVAEQGLKSGGQQTTNNLIAQHYYDANRGLFDEVIEASGGSLTPTLVISLLQMTAARGWHVREEQLRKKWQRAAPAESGAVSREASPAVASKAGQKQGGVSREQAKQWVDEVLRKWGSKLDVTVHESAETIPDAALRERVLKEGDVDGIFNGSDGKIHILADRVDSASGTERLLKHEGFHWVVDGPLKTEYESLREWARKQIPADKLEQLRRNYPEEVTVEEYLANLAETNPESTVWKQFVYEFRRLLRRILGDRVEFTEEDLRAFLAKAQKRVERAQPRERGDSHPAEPLRERGDDPRFSRSARALLDGEKSIPPALALQAMREVPDHPVTRALESWFVGGFRDIQNGKAPETEAILRKFLLRLPPYESKTPLYRGVPFRNEPELRAFLKQFQGDEWANTRPFMSTTKESRLAYGHVQSSSYPVLLEIKNVHSGYDLEPFKLFAEQFKWQREVIYQKRTRFKVIQRPKIVDIGGKLVYFIRLEEE